MSNFKSTISATMRSKAFKNLEEVGLAFVSTDRQLENGTLAFRGKFGRGRKRFTADYAITASGNVFGNKFKVRDVESDSLSQQYRNGLNAISEMLDKRLEKANCR
jgi:hypothetical protein